MCDASGDIYVVYCSQPSSEISKTLGIKDTRKAFWFTFCVCASAHTKLTAKDFVCLTESRDRKEFY